MYSDLNKCLFFGPASRYTCTVKDSRTDIDSMTKWVILIILSQCVSTGNNFEFSHNVYFKILSDMGKFLPKRMTPYTFSHCASSDVFLNTQ